MAPSKKAAMLDWLFGYKKIIIVVDTSDNKMMLVSHGQYVGDGYVEAIKLPNMVSSAEHYFRYQMPYKFYFAHELQNSIECKAKWLRCNSQSLKEWTPDKTWV